MKIEEQIAEENVKWTKDNKGSPNYKWYDIVCKTHKTSCQREKEFLEKIGTINQYPYEEIQKKITDLEQAIKLYDEAGI